MDAARQVLAMALSMGAPEHAGHSLRSDPDFEKRIKERYDANGAKERALERAARKRARKNAARLSVST